MEKMQRERERGRKGQDGSEHTSWRNFQACCRFPTQSHNMASLHMPHLSVHSCLHCPAFDSDILLL